MKLMDIIEAIVKPPQKGSAEEMVEFRRSI